MKSFKKINELRAKDHITEKEMHKMKRDHCIDMMEKLVEQLEQSLKL